MSDARPVLFLGSIGLDTARDVFREIGSRFGARLRCIPDGEAGPRKGWLIWQYALFRSSPFLQPDLEGPTSHLGAPRLKIADSIQPSAVRFDELGYAQAARASYLDFCAARQEGHIAPSVRFQVCLPTPFAVTLLFCTSRDRDHVEAAYERAMIAELRRLCDAIPHDDLTIQWDFCLEMILIDGQLSHRFATLDISIDTIMERLRRISSAIPDDVDLGVHLCYGDLDGKHTINPQSAEKMVDAANALASAVKRPLSYIHFPVPLERSDEEFFAPLRKLDLSRDTAIYLGVIHAADGVAGTRRRIASAQRFLPMFGIASECGIARRTPEVFLRFLDVYDLTSRPGRPR
jgi:hypothetical protein